MKIVNKIFKEYTIWVALIVISVFFSFNANRFFTVTNAMNILNQSVTMGIMAAGVVFVQIAGGVDLTVGAQLSICGVVTSMLMVNYSVHPVLACIAGISVCVLIGAINGIIVTKFKIIAIIATLGMAQIIQGVSYTICKGVGIYNLPSGFSVLGQGYVGVVPVPVIIYAAVSALVLFVLNCSYFGRYFYAVGGNAEAARLAGVDPNKVRFASYMISGFFCGVAGIVTLSRLNCGLPGTGLSMNMDVMTSVVLGGVSAMVARSRAGKYICVIAGSILMAVISNGLVLMGASEYLQNIIKGLILLFALSMDNMNLSFITRYFKKDQTTAAKAGN